MPRELYLRIGRLYFVEGFGINEISELLYLSRSTVGRAIVRFRRLQEEVISYDNQ